jgi:hypothetical protein
MTVAEWTAVESLVERMAEAMAANPHLPDHQSGEGDGELPSEPVKPA